MHEIPVMISAGDGAYVTVNWKDALDAPATPTSVRYQVFDARTGVKVSGIGVVGDLGSTMEFVVPANMLPAGPRTVTKLVIQVEGSFNTNKKIVKGYLDVERPFTMAA